MPVVRSLAVLFSLLLAASPACGASIVLEPSQDNTLYQSGPGSLSNGLGTRLFVGRTGQGFDFLRRALLHFDVAGSLPSGSTITGVTLGVLVLQSIDGVPRNTSAHRVTASWGEGTSVAGSGQGAGGGATANSATWVHRFFSATAWATPGGDFNPGASATTAMPVSGFCTWTDAGLIADVQDMLDNPANNHGWLLLGDESVGFTARALGSREASPGLRPTLTIQFDAPVPVERATWGAIKSGADD